MKDILFVMFEKPINAGFSGFLGSIIEWLVSISSVVVGIILFTLLLKLITLPFDFMSRVSMRKNSIKMEEMRPELEKLQKQYANDKALYNQKMMAIYKKNGYSLFGACLPTIFTLVIFIIAINGFSTYSQFKNKQYFYEMSVAYNNVYYSGIEVDGDYIERDSEGNITLDLEKLYNDSKETAVGNTKEINVKDSNNRDFTINVKKGESTSAGGGVNYYFDVSTTNSYIYIRAFYSEKDGNIDLEAKNGAYEYYLVSDNNFANLINENNPLATEENNGLKDENGNIFSTTETDPTLIHNAVIDFLKGIAQTKSAEEYRNVSSGFRFLWVKNVWVVDSPLAHPIPEKLGKDASAVAGCGCGGQGATYVSSYGNGAEIKNVTDEQYTSLINKLEYEKTAPNGYFILAILTALTSFLSQFIITRSQKAQMELQTVNGQGAQSQKMMMWMMPILMAFFAFMYTASFSIYIILSSVLTIVNTLVINKIVDIKYKSKNKNNNSQTRSRVYIPKEEEKNTKNEDNKQPIQDFVALPEQKKPKIRGRLK